SAIIPVLCEYEGSIICLDPKGENAFHTASRRGFGTSDLKGSLGQDVYILDPYDESGAPQEYLASFDPLAGLHPTEPTTKERVTLIAEALVVRGDEKDAHFNDSAQNFIEALILHVLSWATFEGRRSLGMVYELLTQGALEDHAIVTEALEAEGADVRDWTPFDTLLRMMKLNDAFDGSVAAGGHSLSSLGDRELGSVLSTARRNLKFLDSREMRAVLSSSDHALDLGLLKRSSHGVSVYIVLPARLMGSHFRWMRLILNLSIAQLERDKSPPETGQPVLAILDEFAALGHMPILETAIGYMAGFGLKIWAILQDLPQLQRHYAKGWETFLGNAGLIQAFGNADITTLEYISKRLGQIEVLREVNNVNTTRTETTTELSDFEKLQRTENKGPFGRMRLGNETETKGSSTATTEALSRSLQVSNLMTADEVRLHFSRESKRQMILLSGHYPIFLARCDYYDDPHFAGKFTPSKDR
ncbi:MAG: type IV secretory system conjugative DNA transfer family protein, partial [Pseudomonadota bacterium]